MLNIPLIAIAIIVIYFLSGIKIVKEWERLAVLTLGKFSGIKGPGIIIVFPILQTIAAKIDMRVSASRFQSETTLTRDGVTVTVEAALFWKVIDPKKATLVVNNYTTSVQLAAQTTLRDVIGKMNLADILSNIQELDYTLKESIGVKVNQWGIETTSVEIRDVSIPEQLQEVMSRAAQAEREKQARITYGEAEIEAARKFVEASRVYESDPHALQLRAMTIMYEALKSDTNTVIVVPSNMSDSLNPTVMSSAISTAIQNTQNNIGE